MKSNADPAKSATMGDQPGRRTGAQLHFDHVVDRLTTAGIALRAGRHQAAMARDDQSETDGRTARQGRLRIHFSSRSCEWPTPQPLFDALNRIHQFTLDPAANHFNHKTAHYYTIKEDGLAQVWTGNVFLNPPYSRLLYPWVEKAYETGRRGHLVVALLPARTDVRWFSDFVLRSAEICFVRGRIRFQGGTASAPFPSIIVSFRRTDRSPVINACDPNGTPTEIPRGVPLEEHLRSSSQAARCGRKGS